MVRKYLLVFYSILLCILPSCTPDVLFTAEEYQELVVLNGFVRPGAIELKISITGDPTERFFPEEQFLNDAVIRVFSINDEELDTNFLLTDPGNYSTDFNGSEGDTIFISVANSEYETVVTDPIIIPEATINNVTLPRLEYEVTPSAISSLKSHQIIADLDLEADGSGQVRYYWLLIEAISSEEVVSVDTAIDAEEGLLENCRLEDRFTLVMSNQCFNGSEINLPLDIFTRHENNLDSLRISFSDINEQFYDYLAAENQPQDGLTTLFVQPNLTISNVNQGAGFVAGINTRQVNVHLME